MSWFTTSTKMETLQMHYNRFSPLRPPGDPDEEDGHRGVQRDHKDLRGAVSDSGALQQRVHREVSSGGKRQRDPEVGSRDQIFIFYSEAKRFFFQSDGLAVSNRLQWDQCSCLQKHDVISVEGEGRQQINAHIRTSLDQFTEGFVRFPVGAAFKQNNSSFIYTKESKLK